MSLQTEFYLSFETLEQRRHAVDNIKETLAFIEKNNDLFKKNESSHMIHLHQFSHLSEDEFEKQVIDAPSQT